MQSVIKSHDTKLTKLRYFYEHVLSNLQEISRGVGIGGRCLKDKVPLISKHKKYNKEFDKYIVNIAVCCI